MKGRRNNHTGDGIEALLDAALDHYSVTEPRPGLEQRLQARLQEAPLPSPLIGWRLAVPAALVLGLCAVALFVALRSPSPRLSPEGRDAASVSPEVPKIAPEPPGPNRQDSGAASATTVAAGPLSPDSGGRGGSPDALRTDVRGPLTPTFPVENQEALLFEFLEASAAMPKLQDLRRQRASMSREIAELSIPPLSIEFLPGFNPEDFDKGE